MAETVSFEEYKSWVMKYVNNHDVREINFQNEVVKKLLERLFPEYDIVCTEKKGPASGKHDYGKYCGVYTDKKQRKKFETPDLLIVKNWDWHNKDNDKIQYIATVEVKSPYKERPIYRSIGFDDYPDKWKEQLSRHLSASEISRVVYTDALKWEFYRESGKKEAEKLEKPEKTIHLVHPIKEGRKCAWEWKDGGEAEGSFEQLKAQLVSFLKME